VHWLDHPHHVSPSMPSPVPLKVTARGFFVLFHRSIWSPSTIYAHLNLLNPPSPIPEVLPYTCTVSTLQSCLSLLIFKLMFRGVFQCILAVSVLYFGPFNSFHCSPLPFYLLPPPHFSIAFNKYLYILYLHRCFTILLMLCFTLLLILCHSLFLSFFPRVP
jgi:hypothetical protein